MLRRMILKQLASLPFMPRLKLDLNGGVLLSDNRRPLTICEWARLLDNLIVRHGVSLSQVFELLEGMMTYEEILNRHMLTDLPRHLQDEIDQKLMPLYKAFILATDKHPEEIWETAKDMSPLGVKELVEFRLRSESMRQCLNFPRRSAFLEIPKEPI